MPAWPTTLPGLNVGVMEQSQQGFIRTPTSTGPGKSRKRFSATADYITGQMNMNRAQMTTFKTFYKTTLGEGASAFTMEDPATGSNSIFRFVEVPSIKMLTGDGTAASHFVVNITLERLP